MSFQRSYIYPLLLGGNYNNGVRCGLLCRNGNNALGNANWNYGCRNRKRYFFEKYMAPLTVKRPVRHATPRSVSQTKTRNKMNQAGLVSPSRKTCNVFSQP